MATENNTEYAAHPATDPFYIESTLPAGLTIAEYRRRRPRHHGRWAQLKELAGLATPAPASA